MTKAVTISTRTLLQQLLAEPRLVSLVQNLDARTLGRLINHVGLEDCGEIVALATTEQLSQIFDEDVWRSTRPGQRESFDAERFGVWLAILLEMGPARAAEKLTELDEDFLTLALSKQVLVLDLDALALQLAERSQENHGISNDELLEKALESSLCHEFEKFAVLSLNAYSWDAVLSALVALDSDHHDFLVRLFERCCYLSSEYIEDNGGLYEVLTADEQLESDVSYEREKRREQEGFVPPETATAFLKLACGPVETKDFVSSAHLRALREAEPPKRQQRRPTPHEDHEAQQRFNRLLAAAEVIAPKNIALLSGPSGPPQETKLALLRGALAELEKQNAAVFSERFQEISFLANTLLAGASLGGRVLRPAEAVEAALGACNIGLESILGRSGRPAHTRPAAILANHSAIELFRHGWNLLHERIGFKPNECPSPGRGRFYSTLAEVQKLPRR